MNLFRFLNNSDKKKVYSAVSIVFLKVNPSQPYVQDLVTFCFALTNSETE